eukprot:6611614-Alexandrium_andersonii.AAC.1
MAVRAVRRRGRRPSSALRSARRWACSASQVDRPTAASSRVRRSVGSPWPASQQRVVSERLACSSAWHAALRSNQTESSPAIDLRLQ